MGTYIILQDSDRQIVENGVDSGPLFDAYGTTKGYKDGYELHPRPRAGGVYILGIQNLTAMDDEGDELTFGTAVPYLENLPQMDSSDPNFPGPP